MPEKIDVDPYKELEKVLEDMEKGKPEERPPQKNPDEKKPEEGAPAQKGENDEGSQELTEEEISKLSPRAQKRIHALTEQVKELAQKTQKAAGEPPADTAKTEQKPEKKEFQNIKEFLDAVEDEPSRELLSHLYNVIKKETSSVLGPVEQRNNEARFETEFSVYAAKFPNLADHKDDLRKTFLRNPETPIKSLIGDTLVDLQMAKVENQAEGESKANREGKPDLDSMSKEDLYGELENQLGSLPQ